MNYNKCLDKNCMLLSYLCSQPPFYFTASPSNMVILSKKIHDLALIKISKTASKDNYSFYYEENTENKLVINEVFLMCRNK